MCTGMRGVLTSGWVAMATHPQAKDDQEGHCKTGDGCSREDQEENGVGKGRALPNQEAGETSVCRSW